MPVKVSIVVPVYNPGVDILPGAESFLTQTLPAEEFEVIYVDDGSTDETPEIIDKLVGEHPNFSVIRIPNSGWPGRPRNLGIEAAQGEYVQLVDQDDRLAPDALRRLYEMGSRNGSDIVIGKVASNFRGVPHWVFREDLDRSGLDDGRIIHSLTPHKMFRTAFLREHGLRFPEGKWILEDQLFIAQAYLAAETVSILSSYTCYYYWQRTTGENNADSGMDPVEFCRNHRTVLEVFLEGVAPGPGRDRLLSRFLRSELHGSLIGASIRDEGKWRFDEWFDNARPVALDCYGEGVVAEVGGAWRAASVPLWSGDRERARAWYRYLASLKASARLEGGRWLDDGTFAVDVAVQLVVGPDGDPLELVRDGDRYYLDPEVLSGVAFDGERFDVTDEITRIEAEVVMRGRDDAEQWSCDGEFTPVVEETGEGRCRVVMRGSARIATEAAGVHGRLPRGFWDIWVPINGFGIRRTARLGADRAAEVDEACRPALLGAPSRAVIPYFTEPHGNLTFDVERKHKRLAAYLEGRVVSRAAGPDAVLRLDLASTSATVPKNVRLQCTEVDGTLVETKAVLYQRDGATLLPLPAKVPGAAAGPAVLAVKLDAAKQPALRLCDVVVKSGGTLVLDAGLPVSEVSGAGLPRSDRPRSLASRVRGRLARTASKLRSR